MSVSRPRRARSLGSWAVRGASALLLVGWFLTLAPTTIGGPATYAIVDGVSMEPLLHTGDLAVARSQPSYSVGDLVVIHFERDEGTGGTVIHRIVSGSPRGGWATQGDNNSWIDPWTVRDDEIAGRYIGGVPGFGTALAWAADHSWLFGLVCSVLVALSYLPLRRRRITAQLTEALSQSERESRPSDRSGAETAVLALTATAALASLALVAYLAANHAIASSTGAVAGMAFLWSGGLSAYLAYRLYDGRGVAEPSKSLFALSGRLHLVDRFPEVDEVQPVASAIALRSIAEKYRLPVLHRVDAETGAHGFLLLTARKGAYCWTARPTDGGRHVTRPSVAPVPVPVPVPVQDPAPAVAVASNAAQTALLTELFAPRHVLDLGLHDDRPTDDAPVAPQEPLPLHDAVLMSMNGPEDEHLLASDDAADAAYPLPEGRTMRRRRGVRRTRWYRRGVSAHDRTDA